MHPGFLNPPNTNNPDKRIMNSQPQTPFAIHPVQAKPSGFQRGTSALTSLILLLATAFLSSTVSAVIVSTPVGTPAWQPTDIHLFVAPVGSAPNFDQVLSSLQALLPEPNHRPHPDLFIGPGDQHNPPYTQELAIGLASSAFQEKTVFDASDFSAPNGIYLAMMNVPGFGLTPPAQGSSPDFASGPIIANSLFPISVLGETFRNGALLPAVSTGAVPPLDSNLNPPFNVNGHSHFPQFYIDNADFNGVTPEGSYVYNLTLRDTAGNGWDISASFQVIPEPGTCLLLGLGALGTVFRARRQTR